MMRKIFFLLLTLFIIFTNADRASSQNLSLPADGKDFFVGYIYPSYNKVANASTGGFYGAYILVSSYTDNHVTISYFDKQTGVEIPAQRYTIPARTGIQIALNRFYVQMGDTGDVPEFSACHVTADRAINVEFFSTGACSGGSYLALATPVLGKKYVVASYNDNPGNGGLLGGFLGPSSLENSHGCFEIIAPFDGTTVTITPNATTMGGHRGVNSGAGSTGIPLSYKVALRRGQCYFVKSGSNFAADDISGSIIESDKPIAVLGAHENAFIGGVSGRNLEGRDFMIEQMIPVEYWDTTGYVSIPLKDSPPADPSTYQGVGENYRIYAYDSLGSNVKFFDQCNSSTVNISVPRYAHPTPERSGIICPIDFEATNGKPFSVMMYDQRNVATASPYPAPSMMTIVPVSHWRTSYIWFVPANKFESLQGYYINIICQKGDLDTAIKASYNGDVLKPIKQVMYGQTTFQNIPNYPNLMGQRFQLGPGSYYAIGPHPFMVYSYGFRGLDPNFDIGDFDGDDFFFSYALPIGMKLATGQLHLRVTVDTSCSYWNVCVHDSAFGQGIKSVTLLDDPNGDFVKPGYQYKNAYLDDSLDPDHTNEIYFSGDNADVCFKVLVNRPIDSAYAPLFITDASGNAKVVELKYFPPQIRLSSDSGRYLKAPLMKAVCSSFVFTNTSKTAGKNVNVISTALKSKNPNFKITSITPSLPAILKSGDSLVITACFTPKDTGLQKDTINLITSCFTEPIDLAGQGAIPIIAAGNHDFGNVLVDSTKCDTISVQNIGTAPLILTNKFFLSNTINFTFKDSLLLPVILNPGQVKYFTFCYTPHKKGIDSAVFYWGTNEVDPYKHSKKDSTILRGGGVKSGFIWDRTVEVMEADSMVTNDSVIARVYLLNNSTFGGLRAHIDSVYLRGADVSEFYILENQLHAGKGTFGNFDLTAGDSIWVDVVFKPDITKPYPQRYTDRHADLIATDSVNDFAVQQDQVIHFTGTWTRSGVMPVTEDRPITIIPNPVSGNSIFVSLSKNLVGNARIAIYDVLGREVYRRDVAEGISGLEIPVQKLFGGVYYLRFTSDTEIKTQKFEVSR